MWEIWTLRETMDDMYGLTRLVHFHGKKREMGFGNSLYVGAFLILWNSLYLVFELASTAIEQRLEFDLHLVELLALLEGVEVELLRPLLALLLGLFCPRFLFYTVTTRKTRAILKTVKMISRPVY